MNLPTTSTLEFENPTLFRFRAETPCDVTELVFELGPKFIAIALERKNKTPDVEALIKVDGCSLDEMRDYMRRIEDGHVMLQTVQQPI